MKTFGKVVLIVVCVLVVIGFIGMGIAFFATGNTANADEYSLGNDTIKSVKAVVEKRDVTSVSSSTSNGVSTKEITYKSNTVYQDLLTYTQYLRSEGGFVLTKDMNLNVSPSTVQLGKESVESGKIILLTISYDSLGYTISIQKGAGTLNRY